MENRKSRLLPWGLLPGIWALAWPTMLEELSQTAVQYADTAMVGALGTDATAAVGATVTVNWLVGSTIHALAVGFLAYIAQALGADRPGDAHRAAGQGVLAVLTVGAAFTAITLGLSPFVPAWMQVDEPLRETASRYFFILYAPMLFRTAIIVFGTMLRAAGDARTPMRIGLAMNVLNVCLNALLIPEARQRTVFGVSLTLPGAGLGVTGAALASALAFAAGGILITVAFLRNPAITPKGQKLTPQKDVLLPCLKVALPNALQRFATSLGYVVFASLVNALGTLATATHTVANTVESAFYVPGYGMQTAAATLAGRALGAKDLTKLKDLRRMLLVLEVALMVVSGGLLFVFAPELIGIFSKDPAVAELGTTVLRMVAVSEPFYGVSIIIEGMLQGLGRTGFPFAVNVMGMWGVRIALTFVFTRFFGGGLVEAWGCMIGHNLLLFTVFSIHFILTLRRWTENGLPAGVAERK
ncbi:MAG: MATE family efflux transporter [Clostridia bacterium]|nr:MATE family efflux transporter [Clostridia bacterium]